MENSKLKTPLETVFDQPFPWTSGTWQAVTSARVSEILPPPSICEEYSDDEWNGVEDTEFLLPRILESFLMGRAEYEIYFLMIRRSTLLSPGGPDTQGLHTIRSDDLAVNDQSQHTGWATIVLQ